MSSICWLDSYLLLHKWCWCYCYCCCRCCLCCQLCLCDYEIIHQSEPAQPRSPCQLPLADHPHRPGSHQQSCCPLSNFQKLNFVTHIGRLFHLKNMRSPSTTQPFTRKELKELDFRVSDRELEDLWELKDHGELKELRELKELCPQSVFVPEFIYLEYM